MTDAEWLASLKVGDEVAVHGNSLRFVHPRIKRVDSITTTGRVVICGVKFTNGRNRAEGMSIVPVTDKLREDIKRTRIVVELRSVNWGSVDTAKLEQIAALAGIEVQG